MKRSRPRRKSARQQAQEGLHDLWREVLIARDGRVCCAAGQGGLRCGGPLQAHHVYGRGPWPALRFDLDNGLIVCRNHHLYWVEVAPATETGPWLTEVCGTRRLERLALRARACNRQPCKHDLAGVRLFLESELRRVTAPGARP